MKDRLIELIRTTPPTRLKCVGRAIGKTYTTESGVVDHLLANGVIVPPCKVGDTVYQTDGVRIYPSTIQKVIYDTGHIDFDESAIGKSIFLTREEAQKALAKMKGSAE